VPAHALVALAHLAPDQALSRLDRFVKDERWQVRMYAARAAGVAKAADVLTVLADDRHDNVREAAIVGLRQVKGREADAIYLAALGRRDDQLLIAAAQALEGTALRAEASAALLDALERVTAAKRETSRDARKALLTRLAETGSKDLAARLAPFARDFDPIIADLAATTLSSWTGSPVKAAPGPLPRAARPSPTDIDSMGSTRVVFTIRDVGRFEVRLIATEAPLNAWRFLRLARERFYNGRTIHRVVPIFVLQGGSPGANEYVGDGPYTRDEVGLQSNLRGTIGVSTRGRDTGDGQIYFNLVDNMRLDHTYTVFAQIEKGVDVLDAILEGDVIEDVDVIAARR
jgi:cyclophilin family peptidyl-prolyl cis-trans isomerase